MAGLGGGRLGGFRLGESPGGRLGAYQPWVRGLINGVARRFRVEGASISDELNHDPNTATFRVEGTAPIAGQSVAVYQGEISLAQQIFGGVILTVTAVHELTPTQLAWDLQCIDYTWLLNRRTVLSQYPGGVSASAVLADVLAYNTQGFTWTGIAPNLPMMDAITFTNEDVIDCLTRICARFGGYHKVDYGKDVKAYLTAEFANPITQAAPRTMVGIQMSEDLSQVATQVTVRGGGSTSLVERSGAWSTLPVADIGWYAAGGGVVEVGAQRIAYTGVAGFVGLGSTVAGRSLTLPGTPAVALNLALGNLRGSYSYKVAFVFGEGESLPSLASAVVTTEATTPDGQALTLGQTTTGAFAIDDVVRYRVAFITAAGDGFAGRPSAPFTVTVATAIVTIAGIPIGPGGTTGRRLYRSINGGPYQEAILDTFYHVDTDNTGTVTWDWAPSGNGARVPLEAGRQIDTSFAVGPTGTTARRLYRTTGTGTVYKRVATIPGNSTGTFIDNVADDNLGDEPPVDSTVPTFAGDSTIRVADLALFPVGGWVQAGDQLIRYTGRTFPDLLTGVNATGTGSILTPISVGTAIISVPHLIGCTGMVYPIAPGDQVNIVVTLTDAAAVAVMAARLPGTDGIHQLFLSDGRWAIPEATAQCQAALTQRKDPLRTVTFGSRDPSIEAGRDVAITLTSPAIVGVFRIQRVSFSELGVSSPAGPMIAPLRSVEASSHRYSIEDILRSIRGKVAA